MSAASILSQSIGLFCTFGTLIFIGKRLPAHDRRTGQDRRKKAPVNDRRNKPVPNQQLSDVVQTPDDVVNHIQVIHRHKDLKPLTWLDVDVAYCTEDELLMCVASVIQSCKKLTLNDREITKFWEVRQELERRNWRALSH
jgi:hypothetical protein